MMDCRNYQNNISALIDDELSPSLETQLMLHMESCAECQSIFDDFLQMEDLFQTVPPEQALSHEWSAIAAEMPRAAPRYYRRLQLYCAAAIALFAFLGIRGLNSEDVKIVKVLKAKVLKPLPVKPVEVMQAPESIQQQELPLEYISALFMDADEGKTAQEAAYAQTIMHQFIQP